MDTRTPDDSVEPDRTEVVPKPSDTVGIWSHRCPVLGVLVDAPEWTKFCLHCKRERPDLIDGRRPRECEDVFRWRRVDLSPGPEPIKVKGIVKHRATGRGVEVELEISRELYDQLGLGGGAYSIREAPEPSEINYNEYAFRFEDGHWYLVGGPNGTVHHKTCPCGWYLRDRGVERPQARADSKD